MIPRSTRLTLLAVAATLVGIAAVASGPAAEPAKKEAPKEVPKEAKLATATFAGGCFWCMEPPFDKLPGVVSTTSGYIGGSKANPTYEEVSEGGTGHAEAVQVIYDPSKVSYTKLLEVFWRNVDPLTPNAQFCDSGSQYRSAIFFHDAEQQKLAEESRRQLEASGRFKQPIVTQLVSASAFYAAEEYHQDYYQKNPIRYRYYRNGCGRDARLKEVWGEDAPKK
jgi:peptide-methionine (S)-S-oxide reductase